MQAPQLPRFVLPPLWREAAVALEAAGLVRDPIFREGPGLDGNGQAVLLVPGFLAGDGSLGVMTTWLRKAGFRTKRAGIRFNVACSGEATTAMEERLEAHAERHGPVIVIGQSRGGHFARALAVRRPDLVRGIVTLGTPMLDPFAVHPLVLAQVGLVGALGTLGVGGLFRHMCLAGSCCEAFRETMTAPIPDEVGYVSVYSRNDGIVDWRVCLDPAADDLVEVDASHCGMALHAGTYRAVAGALAGFEGHHQVAAFPPLAQAA